MKARTKTRMDESSIFHSPEQRSLAIPIITNDDRQIDRVECSWNPVHCLCLPRRNLSAVRGVRSCSATAATAYHMQQQHRRVRNDTHVYHYPRPDCDLPTGYSVANKICFDLLQIMFRCTEFFNMIKLIT